MTTKNEWGDEVVSTGSGDEWGDTPAAKKDLPAGVKPSTAGAGRGGMSPVSREAPAGPSAQPVQYGLSDIQPTVTQTAAQPVSAAPRESVLEVAAPTQPWDMRRDAIPRRAVEATPQARNEGSIQETPLPVQLGMDARKAIPNPAARGVVAGLAGLGTVIPGAVQAGADALGADGVADYAGKVARTGEQITAPMRPTAGGDKLAFDIANSITQTAPTLIMGLGGGPAMTALFGQTAAQEYTQGRSAGLDGGRAAARAGVMAGAEVLGERFGFTEQIKLLKGLAARVPVEELAPVFARQIMKEIPGEQLTTLIQFLGDKAGPGALNPEATLSDYLTQAGDTLKTTIGQTAVMGGGPTVISAARQHLKRPTDRAPQIKALRDSGDETSAAILEQRQKKETAVYTAEVEADALADFGADLQTRYRETRMTGVNAGDAVVQTAARWNFEQAAQMAGLSPKAQEAIAAKLAEVPPEKAAAFVQKAVTGLVNAGMAQPFDGMDQLATTIEAHRDQMLDSVLGAMDSINALEAQQDGTQDTADLAAGQALDPGAPAALDGQQGATGANGIAEPALPDGQPEPAQALNPEWTQFPEQTGTLNIPRAEMPQVKTAHRGPLVNFLGARGVTAEQVEVDPADLKPTQAEFSQSKVDEAADRDTDRSILISSDGHIIDGHHQAIAKLQNGKPVRAIKLGATAEELIPLVHEFPSSTVDQATNVQNAPQQPTGTEAQAAPVEAPAPAGGDVAAATGVPATDGAGNVQADGVKTYGEEFRAAGRVASGFFGSDFVSNAIQNDWQKLLDAASDKDTHKLSALEDKYRKDEERDGLGAGTSGAGPGKVKQSRRGAAQLPRFARAIRNAIEREQSHPKPETQPEPSSGAASVSPQDLSTNQPKSNTSAEPAQETAKTAQVEALGRNSQPISEGGKPFKTQAEASKEKKLHPTMRVVKSDDGKGYVLKPASEKQIAAWAAAAKRIKAADTGEAGPLSLHGFILSRGGLARSSMADAGFDKNERIGNRWLFTNDGKTLAQMSELLHEAGFISEETENAVSEGLRRSLKTPVYTAEGYEAMAQAEAEARLEDHMAAQQEAQAEEGEDFDPFPADESYTDDDAQAAGFDDASQEDQAAFAALLHAAEAEGIDTEAITEQAAQATQNGTDDDYRNETRALIEAARSERAQAAERARVEQGRKDAEREGGGDGRQGAGEQGAPGSQSVTLEPRPDGTISVKGDTKALRERLTAAGIPARSIMPSANGVVVGKTQAQRARNVLEGREADKKAARTLNEDGRATDGKPINAGDVFTTLSGRETTPYPKQQAQRFASQWLIDNAIAEAKQRGDDFNATGFSGEKPLKDGTLADASRESMLMYLFGEQPAVVPSILKPLTGEKQEATTRQPIADDVLEDLGLLRMAGDRWKYKFSIDGGFFTANSKEDAVERATDAYYKAPADQRLTSAQRAEKADAELIKEMDRAYGDMSLSELRQRYERIGGDIASLQSAGAGEFNGNGGRRTRAATSNEAARTAGQERLRLGIYIKHRESLEQPAAQDKPKARKQPDDPRAEYFTPGNVVKSYSGFDEVLEYKPTDNGGFTVRVHEVRKVDGEWVRVGKPQDERTHRTQPEAKNLKDGPVDRLPFVSGEDVKYTEPRRDGQPFQNAPDRGTALAAPTRADIEAQQDRTEQAARDKAAADRAAERAAAQDEDRKRIAKASEQAADTFELGGDAMANLTGQKDIFGEPEPQRDDAKQKAADDLKNALGDLGDIFGKNFRANMLPEQEQKLLPVLSRVMDAAFRLGYLKFKDAAKFTLDKIREALGADVADVISLQHLQGAYVAMSGKYLNEGAQSIGDVAAVRSLGELLGSADAGVQSSSSKVGSDGLMADAKSSPNRRATEPGGVHGYSPADVNALRSVNRLMLRIGKDRKVLNSVVSLVPVDVVDVLSREQLSPESLFNDQAVLIDLAGLGRNPPVAERINAARSVMQAAARFAAEPTTSRDLGWTQGDFDSALKALDDRHAAIISESIADGNNRTQYTGSQEASNAASPDARVERNRSQPTAVGAVGDTVPGNGRGTAGTAGQPGGQADRGDGSGQQDLARVQADGTVARGERGDQRVPGGNGPAADAGISAGTDFSERGPDIGIEGVPPDAIPASEVADSAANGDADLKKRAEQRAADIKDINELFDRLEDMSVPPRAMTKEQEKAAAEPEAPAPRTKPAKAEVVPTVDRKGAEIVEHTTAKGKVIRGIIRKDLTKEQAQEIDPYTWKKDGRFFIREKYLKPDESLSIVDGSPKAGDTATHGPATQAHRDATARLVEGFSRRIDGGLDKGLLDAVAPGDGTRGRAAAAVAAAARRLFGTEVVFVKFSGKPLFNGAVSKLAPGYIFINIDSQKPFMAVLGHELLHHMAKNQPGIYADLSNRIDALIKDETTYAIRTVNAYREAGISLAGLDTREELEADIVGDFFTETEFWAELAKHKPGLFKRYAQAIMQWLDNVAAKLGKLRPFGTEEFLTDIAAARAAVADAVGQFSGAEVGAVTDGTDGDVKLSIAAAANGSAGLPPSATQAGMFAPTEWDMPAPTKLDRVIYEMQDGKIDLKRVQEAIKAAGAQIAEPFDARLAETLYPGRVATRAQRFLDDEAKPLLEAMARNHVELDELSDYLHARGAKERNAQIAKVNPDLPDGGSGKNSKGVLMTNAAAAAYLAGVSQSRKMVLDAMAKRVDAITKGTRQMLVAEGLEKQETIDAWEDAYKNYVPMFRDEAESGNPHPTGSGMSVRGSSSKRATGSTKQVTNVLAHVLMQREAAITRAEKNRVAVALYGLALTNPNRDFWTTIRPGMKADKIAEELDRIGVDPMVAVAGMQGVPTIKTVDKVTGTVVSRPNPIYKSMPGAMSVRINGEDRVLLVNVNDPRGARMAQNLKNLDGLTKMDIAGSLIGKTTRWMASVNTQYNPAFGLVNLIRDTVGGSINLTSTPLHGKTLKVLAMTAPALRGIALELSGRQSGPWGKLFRQFQADGGQTGYREQFKDAADRTKQLADELKTLQKTGHMRHQGVAEKLLHVLDIFNTTLENAVRLAAYKEGLDIGISRAQSARIGRELTVDFNRKGRIGREAGPLYAFFNASVQGTARTIETLNGPAGAKIIAGGMLLGTMQAIMLLAAGYDDDEIPEFAKSRALIIPLPWLEGKQYLAIPLPLGLHVLPNTGRVLTELTLDGGKDAGAKTFAALGEIAGSFNPLGGGNVFTADGALKTFAPTVVDPVIEIGFNRNFAGTPIERDKFGENDQRPGYERSREGTQRQPTGQAYIAISKAINALTGGDDYEAGKISWTPEMWRYLAQLAGGGLLRETEKIVNTSFDVARGDDVKPAGVPIFGRLYGEVDDDSVQRSRYYDNLDRIAKAENVLKATEKKGDVEAYGRVVDTRPEVQLAKTANKSKTKVAELNKLAMQTVDDRDMGKQIDEARTGVMRGLNEAAAMVDEPRREATLGSKLKKSMGLSDVIR